MDGWLSGAVAVTGAEGHVGRHVCERLAALPNDVRSGDEFAGADAAILLRGSLRPPAGGSYEHENVEPVRAAVVAARSAGVKRIVYLSYVGADPASDNEFLRAKGRAEAAVLRGGGDAVVLRSTYIFGPRGDPGRTAEEFVAHCPGTGDQRVQPVFVRDVADALVVAALDPRLPGGTFELCGPETFRLAEFVDVLGARDRRPPRSVAYAVSHYVHGLTPGLVGVLLRDSVARPPLARDVLGLPRGTHLGDVWARAAAAA